jgi:hypothetical protein
LGIVTTDVPAGWERELRHISYFGSVELHEKSRREGREVRLYAFHKSLTGNTINVVAMEEILQNVLTVLCFELAGDRQQ